MEVLSLYVILDQLRTNTTDTSPSMNGKLESRKRELLSFINVVGEAVRKIEDVIRKATENTSTNSKESIIEIISWKWV